MSPFAVLTSTFRDAKSGENVRGDIGRHGELSQVRGLSFPFKVGVSDPGYRVKASCGHDPVGGAAKHNFLAGGQGADESRCREQGCPKRRAAWAILHRNKFRDWSISAVPIT